jgi:hypothetical protein
MMSALSPDGEAGTGCRDLKPCFHPTIGILG